MFEAALDQEVAEPIDHERIRLSHDRLHDRVFLLRRAHLKLLLQEDGRLLVVVGDDLVHDVPPVARHGAIQETAIVERLHRGHVGRRPLRSHLNRPVSVRSVMTEPTTNEDMGGVKKKKKKKTTPRGGETITGIQTRTIVPQCRGTLAMAVNSGAMGERRAPTG